MIPNKKFRPAILRVVIASLVCVFTLSLTISGLAQGLLVSRRSLATGNGAALPPDTPRWFLAADAGQPGRPQASLRSAALFSFTTLPPPGDCKVGDTPNVIFLNDFETGMVDWLHSGGTDDHYDTWALWPKRTHTGNQAVHVVDPAGVSDQRLVSPSVPLPSDEAPLDLIFWNYQSIERSSEPLKCYDGAVLEISTTDGANWFQLDSQILSGPYDGMIVTGSSNPLSGLRGWCGDPQSWTRVVVNLDDYAGQTIRFRFRLGSDSSGSREGWTIDDVSVQSCRTLQRWSTFLPVVSNQ